MASRSGILNYSNSNIANNVNSFCKTPSETDKLANKFTNKTPGSGSRNKKTPGKTARLTPSRNPDFAINVAGGDRFISQRSESQNNLASYLLCSANLAELTNSTSDSTANSTAILSPQKAEYQRIMSENLNGGVTCPPPTGNDAGGPNETSNLRILSFQKTKAPAAPQGYANANKVLYSTRPMTSSSCKKSMRHIPNVPDRILDAPAIVDDYYLNLLDWNVNDLMAIALFNQVFIWNASSGDIELLFEMDSSTDYVSSLAWCKEGTYLAVGLSNNNIQLWDVFKKRQLRTMVGHSSRVGSLSWNSHVLSSGSRNGVIHNHDVRIREDLVGILNNHTQEVCGLKWSPDGRYLASGGNDNLLNIWPHQMATDLGTPGQTTPIYTLSDHQAAVKALAWCPWQTSILASGGGTADRCIRFWNCNTGSCLSCHDTESQVCSLLWSSHYKEIIASHGYPSYQLAIWKYPQMVKVSELTGHTGRILHTAMSPCGEYVVSAAADESLRLWHCFAVDPEEKKKIRASSTNKKTKPIVGVMPKSLR